MGNVVSREDLVEAILALKKIGYTKSEAAEYVKVVYLMKRGHMKLVREVYDADCSEAEDDDI